MNVTDWIRPRSSLRSVTVLSRAPSLVLMSSSCASHASTRAMSPARELSASARVPATAELNCLSAGRSKPDGSVTAVSTVSAYSVSTSVLVSVRAARSSATSSALESILAARAVSSSLSASFLRPASTSERIASTLIFWVLRSSAASLAAAAASAFAAG